MSVITMLFSENLTPLWPRIAELLTPALKLRGTHSPEDLKKALEEKQAQVWVQWNKQVEAVVVTEIREYPQGRWCYVWLGGADKKSPLAWQKFADIIDAFARTNGCVGMLLDGRRGWARRLKTDEELAITLIRRFK